jgi:hypothetical protein
VASRAEPVAGAATETTVAPGAVDPLPAVPSVAGAIGIAARSAYYHSWRLLPANVLWAFVAVAIAALALVAPLAVLLVPLLALPTAGIFRITTRIARGEAVSFWDAIDAWRTDVLPTLAIGGALLAAVIVLSSNVLSGLSSGSPLGWALATLAGWGLIVTWLLAWTLWPILVDPRRADRPVSENVRIASLLVLAHPVRVGSLGLVLAVFLAVSAVAIVALVTISVAFAALIASVFVLPAADRLEARMGVGAADPGAGIADTP